jgi:SAM-dependent methyltransferase
MYDPAEFGDNWADVYDAHVLDRSASLDPTPAAEFLIGLARGGPVLELGIGTGRVALPLAEAGLAVQGIDASDRMLALLRSNVESKSLNVRVSWFKGDFSCFESSTRYPLVYAIYDAVLLLPRQEDQLNCFSCAGEALEPEGRFVVEAHVPNTGTFVDNKRLEIVRVGGSTVEIRMNEHRPVEQQFVGNYIWFGQSGVRVKPLLMRYAWPSELDLMAKLAGLKLEGRYGGWRRETFDSSSNNHVSVYVKAA